MPNSISTPLDSSLDFEIAWTKRILTHKLSVCQVNVPVTLSACASPVVGQPSFEKVVPPFPMDHLVKVLDSLQGGQTDHVKDFNHVWGDTTSGGWGITEATPVDEEEEKCSLRLGSPSRSIVTPGFVPYSKNSESCDKSIPDVAVTSCVHKGWKGRKDQKYEKKNIYYKAVFRDIRRYFIEELKNHSSSRLLRENLEEFITSKIPSVPASEVGEMVAIIAPFLNYNKYMVEFENKRVSDHKCILDCLQNFTLTKMRRVLKFPAIQNLVNYYHVHTVVDGSSARISGHKTMKKHPEKYLEVLGKIMDISNRE